MALYHSPRIITDGLLLAIDAADINSNTTVGGTTLANLATGGGSPVVANGVTSQGIVTLDGSNDYISVNGSNTSSTLSPANATFSIWFRPSSAVLNSRANSLISRGNYNTAGGFFIHMFTNTVSGNSPSVSATFSHSTTTSYSHNGTSGYSLAGFNVWSNVTVVCDAQISLYINGIHKETANRSNSVSNIIYGNGAINTGGDTNLILCSPLSYVPVYSDGYWEPYKGDFGNFQMWDRRLSPTEITQNYNAQKSRFGL